jgi:PPM family protein phosphatase
VSNAQGNSNALIQGFTIFSTQGDAPSQEDFVIGKKERGLFVVADGFGGSPAGLAAARTACDSVLNFLEREAGDLEATLPFVLRSYFSLAGNVLFNALIHANRSVFNMNKGKTSNERGGTSCVAGFIDEDLMALANVGGCSVFLMRDGKMRELVTPRTYARLRDPLSEDPQYDQAIPLMSMGMSEDLEPEIIEFRVKKGDWLLLQTDGIRSEMRHALLELQRQGVKNVEAKLNQFSYEENATLALIHF